MQYLRLIPRTRQGKRLAFVLLCFVTFLLLLHFILQWESGSERTFAKLNIEIPINFVPVRVNQREPLPTSGQTKIPKRIHQTWKSSQIPPQFTSWIKTWLHHHPDWEYWLWTDESARQLIAEKHPSLLSSYDMYELPVRRADALRYVVLYEYGGVYADMDMEALSSLEPLALKYDCFMGQEPYEHPILDSNFQQLVINALMACRSGHPFMEKLIDNLPLFSTMWHVLDSTGPHFVTALYRQYNETSEGRTDPVYITPSEYFYPRMDPVKINYFFSKCNNMGKLSILQKKACWNLKYNNLPENYFDALKIAFTSHHWSHTYLPFHSVSSEVPIRQIVPQAKIYHEN